jgi:hypothetical protein
MTILEASDVCIVYDWNISLPSLHQFLPLPATLSQPLSLPSAKSLADYKYKQQSISICHNALKGKMLFNLHCCAATLN